MVRKPSGRVFYPIEQIFANKQTFEVNILFLENHFKIQYNKL